MPASRSGIWINPRHGTKTGYNNYGCRCQPCRDANARSMAGYRRQHRDAWRAYMRNWTKSNPEYMRRQILRRHHLSIEQYTRLLAEQDGLCGICGTAPGEKSLQVDHSRGCCPGPHSCGQCVRGLLCGACNSALGFLRDDLDRLEKVRDYLIRNLSLTERRAV